jgi:hypothetical protein
MPDTELSLAVRWAESGAEVPARTTANLRALEAAAGGTSSSIGDRMGTAFQRLEAREPTMVLRRVRGEIEMLGAQAIGSTGQLGRLATSLALLIPGGTMTMGAVAGVGLITAEVVSLANEADRLEKRMIGATAEFAKMGGPAAAGFERLRELRSRLEDLSPDPARRIGIYTREGDPGMAGQPSTIARAQEAATVSLEAGRVMAEIHRDHAEAMKRHADEIKKHADELKRHSEALTRIRQEQHVRDVVPTAPSDRVAADLYRRAALGEAGNLVSMSSAGTTPIENTILGATTAATALSTSRWDPGPPDSPRRDASAERLGKVMAREIAGPVIAMVAGIGRGSGAGAAVAGLGGIAGTMAGLKEFSAVATPLGIVSGALEGFSSLIGGSKKTIALTLDELSQRALDQLKTVATVTSPTSVAVVAPSTGDILRALSYLLGRLQQTDANVRTPVGLG